MQHTTDQHEGHDQGDLLPHTGTQPAQQGLVQPLQPPQQGPAQQQGGFQGQVHQAQPQLGHRIVRRLAVLGQADRVGKVGGYRVGVRGDVTDLPAGQPQAGQGIGHQQKSQGHGHGPGGIRKNIHGMKFRASATIPP